ncbi:MAG: hypothetical protein ACTSXP_07290 [Promethearchaeota archaeon]
MHFIKGKYGIEIKVMMPNEQMTIMKIVSKFWPWVLHSYCHFNFLKHLAEPIAAKDSRLLIKLRTSIYSLSIMKLVDKQKVLRFDRGSGTIAFVFLSVVGELKRTISCKDIQISRKDEI